MPSQRLVFTIGCYLAFLTAAPRGRAPVGRRFDQPEQPLELATTLVSDARRTDPHDDGLQ
jgi:hypothetical protein